MQEQQEKPENSPQAVRSIVAKKQVRYARRNDKAPCGERGCEEAGADLPRPVTSTKTRSEVLPGEICLNNELPINWFSVDRSGGLNLTAFFIMWKRCLPITFQERRTIKTVITETNPQTFS